MPCSGLTLHTTGGQHLLARTMDFDQNPGARVIVIPRGMPLVPCFSAGVPIASPYAQVGMGVMAGPVPAMLDGVNEHGLAGADFYYPGFAHYAQPQPGKTTVSPVQAMQYILATCKNLDEVEATFRDKIALVAEESAILAVVPPLHFIFSDPSGEGMVVEPDEGGISIHRNTIGVITNGPGYPWHLTNLRNYISVRRQPNAPVQMGEVSLSPLSLSSGSWGLPGDYTPPSRFVRVAYLKNYIARPGTEVEGVTAAFHVLSAVDMPRGIVETELGDAGCTMYTIAMGLDSRTYYYHTYDNRRVEAVALPREDLDAKELKVYDWAPQQDILMRN